MSDSNGRKYNKVRDISSREAQKAHETLGAAGEAGNDEVLKRHLKAKEWRQCRDCLSRMRTMGIYVDGRPV